MPSVTFTDALKRFGGMYGSAWDSGTILHDAIEVSGAAEVNRIEVPLVGTTKIGYKPGRESREGTLRIQKIDTKWELFVHSFLSLSVAERRARRGDPTATVREFSLKIEYDDPDVAGKETWQLDGCKIWRMPLGFSITDDIVEREYPLTWEDENLVSGFVINRDTGVVEPKGPGTA